MTQYNVHTARESVERQMRVGDPDRYKVRVGDPDRYKAKIAVLDAKTGVGTIEDWIRATVDELVGKLEKVQGARQVRPIQWHIKISAAVDTLPTAAVPEGFVLPPGLNGVVTPDALPAEEIRG